MFITLEGIEGAGKSTQLELLAAMLEKRGLSVVRTREPGGCQLGRRLRSLLLDCRHTPLDPLAELWLFMADRSQHLAEVVRPALEEGRAVLCDRYADSTFAYQGSGRGIDMNILKRMNDLASGGLMPEITLLLDLSVETGLTRAGERNRSNGTIISEGRFDAESANFHNRVRQGYLDIARREPERVKVIDAARPADAVFAECAAVVQGLCP